MQKDYASRSSAAACSAPRLPGGLAGSAKTVVVLDEGDIAKARLAGQFALVWVQSKGLGMPAYTAGRSGIGSLGPARRRAEGADRARRRPAAMAVSI